MAGLLGVPSPPRLRHHVPAGGGCSWWQLTPHRLSSAAKPQVTQQHPEGSTGSSGRTPQRSFYPDTSQTKAMEMKQWMSLSLFQQVLRRRWGAVLHVPGS